MMDLKWLGTPGSNSTEGGEPAPPRDTGKPGSMGRRLSAHDVFLLETTDSAVICITKAGKGKVQVVKVGRKNTL